MKVVYHEKYTAVYSSDPAAAPGRIESIYNELCGLFRFVEPKPASEEDLELVHWRGHIDSVRKHELVYEVARLAVGGAINAAELAMEGEPAFGLIRPPGHHASRDHSWGFCYFNNIAISIEKLRQEGRIKRALIVDIDLHFGDGSANIFAGTPEVAYFHPSGRNKEDYLIDLSRNLTAKRDCDIVAVSAGFDRHQQDWGGMLRTEDYFTIGKRIKEFAERVCGGRRYAVLEGGYNHAVLGKSVRALTEGLSKRNLT